MLQLFRRFGLVLCGTFFRLALFTSVSIIAALLLYTDRNYFLQTLASNDVYNRLVPAFIESNKNQALSAGGEVTFGDPEVAEIITAAIPPETINTSVELVVNSLYDWLEGKSPTLDFSISFNENRQALAEGLADYAIQRLESLPACGRNQFSPTIDPLSASCRPTQIDLAAERPALVENFLQLTSFIENSQFTSEDIISPNDPLQQRIPFYFQLAKVIWVPLLIVLVLCAGGMVLLSSTTRKGMRRVAYALLTTAGSLIFFTVLFSFVIPAITGDFLLLSSSGSGIDALANDVGITLSRDFAIMTLYCLVPLIVVALLLLILTRKPTAREYTQLDKAGLQSSNEQPKRTPATHVIPPLQSSEVSVTKPKKSKKHKKYRTIPKKEL